MSEDTPQLVADAPDQPFFSLAELRTSHTALLRRQQNTSFETLVSETEIFIHRGCATGVFLDEQSDRRAAQSILDYWMTAFYRLGQEPPDATLLDFDSDLAPTLPDTACPYVGLEAFQEDDSGLFFGRQRLIGEMIEKLKTQPLLAVVGPSGSGKSSLVRAGLIPALKANDIDIDDSEEWHYCRPIVPGSDPMLGLARLTRPPNMGTPTWRETQFRQFQEDPTTLVTLLDSMAATPSVIVIDQFEELFTLCDDEQAQQTFVANLLSLIQSPGQRHILILTMRSDFEPLVTRLNIFYKWFKSAKIAVPPLDASELRDAITRPAEDAGLKFEAGVVDALLHDLLGEPAALPLLQFTLLKLWEHRERNRVTMATYRRIGGGRTALATSADAFYDNLIPEEQVTARRVLLRMARPGEGLEVTSRRIRLKDLNSFTQEAPDRADRVLKELLEAHLVHRITGDTADEADTQLEVAHEAPDRVDRVLTKLLEARLVHRTTGDTADEADTQLEITHEALIRNWPRLVGWLEDERAFLRQRLRLTNAAEQWERLGHEPSALLRGTLLAEVLRDKHWITGLNRLERAYITASLLAEEAERRQKEEQYHQAQTLAEERARRAEAEQQQAQEEVRRLEAEQQQAREQARAEAQTRVAQHMRRLIIVMIAVTALALVIAAVAVVQQRMIVAQEGSIEVLQKIGTVSAAQAASAQTAARQEIEVAHTTQTVVNATNIALDEAQKSADKRGTELVGTDAAVQQNSTSVAEVAVIAQQTSTAVAAAAADAQQTSTAVADDVAAAQATNEALAVEQRATEVAIASREESVAAQEQQAAAQRLAYESQRASNPQDALQKAIDAANLSQGLFVEDALQLAIQRNITPVSHSNRATSATWSTDGQYVLTTGNDTTARIWRTTDAPPFLTNEATLRGHSAIVTSAVWSNNGQYIVTTSRDGTTKIWTTSDWQEVRTFPDQSRAVTSAAWSPTDALLATTDAQTIQIWNPENGTPINTIPRPDQRLTYAAWSGDGNFIVTTNLNKRATIWNVQTDEELFELLETANSAIWREAEILTAGEDSTMRLWDAIDVRNVQEERSYHDQQGSVNFATWHCAGTQFVLTAGEDGTARVWDANNAQILAMLQSEQNKSLAMATTDPGCTRTVTASSDGTIRIYYVAFERIREAARGLLNEN